jgi:acetoin:2,6-dichlorophenolindophenol oxidoreductase subunit beta
MADRFESFDAPPLLVGGDETPIPYAGPLEELWIPSVERIADGVRRTLAY